ncbi:DUF3833 domain-containing protein [Rhodoferax sp. BAB1]|uniref:DUF3833 domain-containing protein n=1 Tax=Rhodoferax sp. BAB1 TaxID=2741720 RepID=UPI001574F30F|nr:DUF3833 domain-containing protein [Rhodoferax sp. BAB1]QKO20958.1 DUF3833 domain-containing protein [Rhodoferax sp. BAB1]
MKRRLLLTGAAALGATTLAACASPTVADYANEKPQLDLRRYFNGTVDAWGVFTDRSGKVVKRFTVVMNCSWTGESGREVGVLDEDFVYSDGTTQKRIWTLKRQPGVGTQGRYTGTAGDVVGEAQGEERGNAFYWGYYLDLPVDGRNIVVRFDDWMYQMNDRVMLNRATMSKWGVTLGEVTLSFTKR